ncbi:SMAKA protein, partial [Crypturellus soui]|nr:SMAKA protein [Crypturellus soui]
MGCIKSKNAFSGPHAIQDEQIGIGSDGGTGEKCSLMAAELHGKGPSHSMVLDYAQRLSQDILDQAMKQWAVTESKYSDIPFIESDVP